MPSVEQKDPSTTSGPAGGTSSVGTSGLSRNEKLALIGLAIAAALLYFFKG